MLEKARTFYFRLGDVVAASPWKWSLCYMRMHSNCCAPLQGSLHLFTGGAGEVLVALHACTNDNGRTTWPVAGPSDARGAWQDWQSVIGNDYLL